MGVFEHFPYTNIHNLNLDWIVELIRKLNGNVEDLDKWAAEHEIDYKELSRKVDGLINHLVDAILPWDSSREYLIYSIVSWEGSNYIAIQDVPVGVMITNTDYWVESNTLVEQLNAISVVTSEIRKENIRHFNSVASMLVEESLTDGAYARTAGYYYVHDGGGALYKIDNITGTAPETMALTNGLYAHIVLDDPEICCVDQLGAVGDGVADDTTIINHCLSTYRVTKLGCNKTYLISNTLYVQYGNSFDGQNSQIITCPVDDFTLLGTPNLPDKVALFIKGREPQGGTELQGYTRYVRNFRLIESGTLPDNQGSTGIVGIYIGYATAVTGSGGKVMYSVYGYEFESIYVHGFEIGINCAEAWVCKFTNVDIRNFKRIGLNLAGQNVNDYYVGCTVDGRGFAGETVGIRLDYSPNYSRRPEGQMFSNCGVFSCYLNVEQQTALSTEFSSCMIDLAEKTALRCAIGSLHATATWFGCRYGAETLSDWRATTTVIADNVATVDPTNKVTLVNCDIVNANSNEAANPWAFSQGFNRHGDIVSNCNIWGHCRQVHSISSLHIVDNSFQYADSTAYTTTHGYCRGNYKSTDGSIMPEYQPS